MEEIKYDMGDSYLELKTICPYIPKNPYLPSRNNYVASEYCVLDCEFCNGIDEKKRTIFCNRKKVKNGK